MADLDKRLAADLQREKSAREAAEAKVKELERGLKAAAARNREDRVAANNHIATLNSMRDLAQGPENPYSVDAREKYEELKRTTLVDKAGNAYYFTDGPSHVNGVHYVGARNSDKQSDYIVVMPKDQDPSVQWEATELAGTDVKTGQPILRPLGTGAKQKAALSAADSEAASQFVTNTEINEREAQRKRDAAKLGPGAPKEDATPPAGARPSDTQVG